VEGANPHPAARNKGLDALAHLAGGLVGEGDGEDVAGVDAHAEQVGDAAGDDARLAAAGGGEDEQGPLGVEDGLALGLVEVGEQVGLGHERELLLRADGVYGLTARGRASGLYRGGRDLLRSARSQRGKGVKRWPRGRIASGKPAGA
jgi:hypothetical protein